MRLCKGVFMSREAVEPCIVLRVGETNILSDQRRVDF